MTEVRKNWFALYTKPRAEFKAEEQLKAEDIENYLPTYKTIRQWSDRKKKITVPLLPGYIFVHATEKERLTALEQMSIVRTIIFEGKPAVIPDWQIENLQRLLDRDPEVSVIDRIMTGTRVKITSGSFCDVEGIVVLEANNERNLVVSIDMLNRSVIVKLPANSVVKKV
ncbi:MAG: UpxY family transcription antiterminator [Bacteroidetes bacterium]|nr:UpxY family transcription antiterminator [Bacteroidota bacterium]